MLVPVPGHFKETMNVNVEYRQDPRAKARQQANLRKAKQQGLAMKKRMEQQNQLTERNNEQIATILRELTQEKLTSDPRKWWTWWQAYIDDKPEQRALILKSGLSGSLVHLPPSAVGTGTLVWTNTGRRPIEQILVGDLVLSQDPDTGELSYKPALQVGRGTTPTYRVDIGKDEFSVAPGLAFWNLDRGWWLARDLEENIAVHRVDGSSEVVAAGEQLSGITHRLLVGEFNSFFIGEEGILVHDANQPEPTDMRVPGLARAE